MAEDRWADIAEQKISPSHAACNRVWVGLEAEAIELADLQVVSWNLQQVVRPAAMKTPIPRCSLADYLAGGSTISLRFWGSQPSPRAADASSTLIGRGSVLPVVPITIPAAPIMTRMPRCRGNHVADRTRAPGIPRPVEPRKRDSMVAERWRTPSPLDQYS
jgi:hypothetical protein